MNIEFTSWRSISDRVEDSLPDCQEKKSFEKHMDAYLTKILRCNTYWEILKSRKTKTQEFILAYKYSPAFWSAVIYSLQMGLVTDLVSFLSDDTASLKTYMGKIIANKHRIFTRRFFQVLQNERTGETKEREWKNRHTNDEALQNCQNTLNTLQGYLPILKKARDKVYCHLDKKSLNEEECNAEIFSFINDDIVEEIIAGLSKIISTLYALYTNIWKATSYSNQNDIRNTFQAIKTYEEYKDRISQIRREEIENRMEMLIKQE